MIYLSLSESTIGGTDVVPVYAGEQICSSGYSFGPSVRGFFIIHFCVSGKGVFYNSTGEHPVSEGELFIIKEGETTTYTADEEEPWHYVWVSFSGKATEVFRQGDVVRKAPDGIIERLKELVLNGVTFPYAYTAIVYTLIHELYPEREGKIDRLDRAKKFIDNWYMDEITVDMLSRRYGFERTYFYRLFKERYGVSPKDYLVEVRMTSAKKFLQNGYSVRTTSCMVGYKDVFNFSKGYKKFWGEPPRSHRE